MEDYIEIRLSDEELAGKDTLIALGADWLQAMNGMFNRSLAKSKSIYPYSPRYSQIFSTTELIAACLFEIINNFGDVIEDGETNPFFYPVIRVLCEATLHLGEMLTGDRDCDQNHRFYSEQPYFSILLPLPDPAGISRVERAAISLALDRMEAAFAAAPPALLAGPEAGSAPPAGGGGVGSADIGVGGDSSKPGEPMRAVYSLIAAVKILLSGEWSGGQLLHIGTKKAGAEKCPDGAFLCALNICGFASYLFRTLEARVEEERASSGGAQGPISERDLIAHTARSVGYTFTTIFSDFIYDRCPPESWLAGWSTISDHIRPIWQAGFEPTSHLLLGHQFFSGQADPAEQVRIYRYLTERGGQLTAAADDLLRLAEMVKVVYTAPAEVEADDLFEDGGVVVSRRALRMAVTGVVSRLASVKALGALWGLIRERLAGGGAADELTTILGIIYTVMAGSLAPFGQVVCAEEKGKFIFASYGRTGDSNYKTAYGAGLVLAAGYPFLHYFTDVLPASDAEWVGNEASSWTAVLGSFKHYDRAAAVKAAWLEDVTVRRAYTPPAMCEVMLGGFFSSVALAERGSSLYFLLKTANGCVPGMINLSSGEAQVGIWSEAQFYSEAEALVKTEEDAAGDMEKARAMAELTALGAFRDILTAGTADAFYSRRRMEVLERKAREKSKKTKVQKRSWVRYMPRGRGSSEETGLGEAEGGGAGKAAHFVSGFLRRLPEGYKASDKQKESASEFSISIPEGFTFVGPHIRGGGSGDEKEDLKEGAGARYRCYSALELLGQMPK